VARVVVAGSIEHRSIGSEPMAIPSQIEPQRKGHEGLLNFKHMKEAILKNVDNIHGLLN
jgi:hypothetical protein